MVKLLFRLAPVLAAIMGCSASHGMTVEVDPLPECGAGLDAPRLVAPLSTSTSSRTPSLSWTSDATTTLVEICSDRACTDMVAHVRSTTTSARTERLEPGMYFWRARAVGTEEGVECVGAPSATWQIAIGARDVGATAWGQFTDPNGDGFADVITHGLEDASVLLGPSLERTAPLPRDPSWPAASLVGPATAIGDADGDGLTDLLSIVGLPDGAHLFLYAGGAGGPTLDADVTGVIGGIEPTRNLLDTTFAPVGDVDGDGYGDVAAYEAPWPPLVLLGSPSGFDSAHRVVLDDAASGYVRALGAGDVDGDGLSDVVLNSDYSRMGVFYGDRDQPLSRFENRTHPIVLYLGTSSTVADWNGDGFADAIAASGNGDSVAAYVYAGGPAGLSETPELLGWRSEAERAFEWLGLAAGDADGDGREDVVGVGNDRPETVSTYVARAGDPARVSEPAVGRLIVLDALGDVQGDGLADFAAVLTDGTPRTRTEIYFGAPGGVVRGPVIER